MDQRSKNKVKLFRTLKVVFYALGLPLFMFAVIITAATEYVGEFAYNGPAATELFANMKVLFNGTALYGVWIAAGVWLLIAVMQIIFTKVVKNRRARTLLVGIVTLVVMLVPVVVLDLVIPVKLDAIASELPEGVTIASYADEKGHFYTRTSASWTPNGKYESNNYYFVQGVDGFLRTYNIGMYGGTKSGTANNTANTPVTFGRLFNDATGKAPFEGAAYANKLVKADTTVTVDGETATVSTNGKGQLVVNDIVFENYYLGATNGLWYRNEYAAEMKDGVYGYASYNHSGQLSDGYVYGIDVALEILEDYYYSQKRMTELTNAATLSAAESSAIPQYTLPSDAEIMEEAMKLRNEYYGPDGEASEYEKWVWNQKVDLNGDVTDADFSLTQEEIANLLDALGVALGGALGTRLKTLLAFAKSIVAEVDANYVMNDVDGLGIKIPGSPVNPDDPDGEKSPDITIVITIGENAQGKEVLNIELGGIAGENKYELGLDSRLISGLSSLLDDLVKQADITRYEAVGTTARVPYTTVAEIVYDVLNGGGSGTIGTVGTIFGLVGGLISIVGDITDLIELDPATVSDADATENMLYGIITNLLSALYWYSDPVIKPVYDFYAEAAENIVVVDEKAEEDVQAYVKEAAREYGEQLANYERAVYEGGMHGYVIGSVLVPGSSLIAGDTLGNGSYSTTVPASYEEVIQFKTELSYKRWLYPLLGVRECLVCFMPFVLLFILLSGAAAEKEMLYATGQEQAKKSKKQLKKGAADADAAEADAIVTADAVPTEGTEPLVETKKDEEVL